MSLTHTHSELCTVTPISSLCSVFMFHFVHWLRQSPHLLHLNISSLTFNKEKLHTLLADIHINFNIIGITETRLKTGQNVLNNIDIENFVIEHTITDAGCSGALLYIKEGMTYKIRNDFRRTESKEQESIFIKIQNIRKLKNVIVGFIY